VAEYLRQARVVEVNRRVEHRGVTRVEVLCDSTCLGVPDPRRRQQGLLAVGALDGVDLDKAGAAAPPNPLDDPPFVLTLDW